MINQGPVWLYDARSIHFVMAIAQVLLRLTVEPNVGFVASLRLTEFTDAISALQKGPMNGFAETEPRLVLGTCFRLVYGTSDMVELPCVGAHNSNN